MSYQAIVTSITVRPHPNADRIQLGDVLGNQVVVGLDVKTGDVGVYFPVDGQFTPEFADEAGLLNASARAKLELPESNRVGFFDHHCRIRAQKFRGEKSEGIWLPLGDMPASSERFDLKAGDMLTQWNGVEIVKKWESKRKTSGPSNTPKKPRFDVAAFPKHMDTEQWRFMRGEIPVGSVLTITEKLHGTSHRVGLVRMNQSWWQRLLGLSPWKRIDGSRNVVLTRHSGRTSFYGTDQFRYDATPTVGRKGEVLYGEIVGFVNGESPIMPSVQVNKKELPEIHAKYGSPMHYHYGCKPGQQRFYVYRIVQFNEDGEGVELSWPQVDRRARSLAYMTPYQFGSPIVVTEENREQINRVVESLVDGPSLEDPRQIREGVIVRVDTPDGHTYWLKNKSWAFKLLEGIVKSDDEYVDLEENS